MTNVLPSIEITPTKEPIGTIIWLHGLGADGNDFAPIVPELNLQQTYPLRFVFPHAPERPVTINNGYVMRAWYDIISMSIDHRADQEGIQESVVQVQALIAEEEKKGIPAENIILAGFSQGAVIALHTGLTLPKKLRGILALSGYLPQASTVLSHSTSMNKHVPIFIGHGTQDAIVPYFLGEALHKQLEQEGYPVTWKAYPMPHSVCAEEIRDIANWIENIFTPPPER